MTTKAQVIISRIDTLCDQFCRSPHTFPRRGKDEQIMRLLQQSITDYFDAMADAPPPDLGVRVEDSAAMGDLFG